LTVDCHNFFKIIFTIPTYALTTLENYRYNIMKKEEYFLTHFDVAIKRESLGRKTVLIIVLDQTLCLKYSIDQVRHSCATNHNSYLNYTLNKLIKIILSRFIY
jgi:hypothetical protein